MRLLITNQFKRGFSLIEVVVSLFILSVSVITIYNLIISTATSSFELEQRYLAKEVANNRIALINTVEKPKQNKTKEKILVFLDSITSWSDWPEM